MKDRLVFAFTRAFLCICMAFVVPFSAANAEERKCATQISNERFREFFLQMRFNLSFSRGEFNGFRIYEKSKPAILPDLGLRSGDLLTHFCGVKVFEAMSAKPSVCCKSAEPTRNGVELTVERNGQAIRVVAPMPNKRVQATRSKHRAPDA